MRSHTKHVLRAVFGATAFAAVGASIAIASFVPRHGAEDLAIAQNGMHGEGSYLPVSGGELFSTAERGGVACMSKEAVTASLSADESRYGGDVYDLVDGLQQAFADAWRVGSATEPVKVSGVVAHLFSDKTGTDWTADVVEIGANGCALSRTLLSGDEWTSILKVAYGPEV